MFISLPNLARLLARGRERAFQGWSALAKTVPSCGHADGARLERSDNRIPNWFAPEHINYFVLTGTTDCSSTSKSNLQEASDSSFLRSLFNRPSCPYRAR